MGPNLALFLYFLQEGEYVKNVLGLEREPFPASLKGSENQLKTHLYKHMFYNPSFLNDKMRKSAKMVPKKYTKVEVYLGGGALWDTFGAQVRFLTGKVPPKCSQSEPKAASGARCFIRPRMNSLRGRSILGRY